MDLVWKLALINERIDAANGGTPSNLDDWKAQTTVVLCAVLGAEARLYKKFTRISYSPGIFTENTDFRPYRVRGVQKAVAVLEAAKRELKLTEELRTSATQPPVGRNSGQRTRNEQR